ncbi:MAG: SpoVG family protein [Planctomycetia bacterium]|nr:SpoVG family protein [Planctomycetia bacterium]
MKITEVRIKLMEDASERLKAFCSITFDDCFVIRDLKIIDGVNGYFVAMPSRKLTAHCPVCRYKNAIRAAFCNQCGARLPQVPPSRDLDGRAKLYADIAHPINSAAREMIQQEVIAAYEEEKIRAKAPGYVSRYDDFDMDFAEEMEFETRMAVDTPETTRPPASSPAMERNFGAGVFE